MASNKSLADLTNYKGVLPYASEIFGIYQPLLGWKSKRIEKRQNPVAGLGLEEKLAFITSKLEADTMPINNPDRIHAMVALPHITIARPKEKKTGSVLIGILRRMQNEGVSIEKLSTEEGLKEAIEEAQAHFENNAVLIQAEFEKKRSEETERLRQQFDQETKNINDAELLELLKQELEATISNLGIKLRKELLDKYIHSESLIAGTIHVLNKNKQFGLIEKIIAVDEENEFKALFEAPDNDAWLEALNPSDKKEIDNVGLSPIGVVHLFRQYFFEFDSFLGSPVGHVWLSPGSSVELIETSTRRTLIEKTGETAFESINKSEKTITDQEEISEAVKEENQQNLKFGASATVNQGWITGSATGTTSINYEDTQKEAREKTHKHMREQSEKISSEIKKNFKSTFKIVTETTDTSSKRYVLNNSTDKLINYEMRRKMRQVGVQVQDIGSYLCWQTFVDEPGSELGLSELIHIAKAADIDPNKKFQPLEKLQPFSSDMNVSIPYKQLSDSRGDLDESYEADGTEIDTDFNEGQEERIETHFVGKAVCERSNYVLKGVSFDYQGNTVELKVDKINPDNSFAYSIHFINFGGKESMVVKANLYWEPAAGINEQIDEENKKAEKLEEAKKMAEEKKAYYEAVKQRVTAVSKLESRKFEALREEERIVVYRKLIDELLPEYYKTTDNHTRHKLSEILNAIFDIDKMLYFVAPEYWRPRMYASHQTLGKMPETPQAPSQNAPTQGHALANKRIYAELKRPVSFAEQVARTNKTALPAEYLSQWGGKERKDNYYISEDSLPAKMGASLGWLLQLDGDERRNAFLNAPWVKTVIPVRPGKELAAVNWLQHIEGKTIDFDINDLFTLAQRIEEKHKNANLPTEKSPEADLNTDKIRATPVDKVYEFGFYSLQGGFKAQPDKDFEIMDQWTEIVPTDQIVPVPVDYDPITGRMKPPQP